MRCRRRSHCNHIQGEINKRQDNDFKTEVVIEIGSSSRSTRSTTKANEDRERPRVLNTHGEKETITERIHTFHGTKDEATGECQNGSRTVARNSDFSVQG
ncbi:hypothetical protein L6452_39342 [Arctium lappa]|uniref:Uncharacterized protein n=1 Tax=Arctium lappa TaxID=4217 RepID=A0ACB8XSQ4_ARCLA|nr:hypothetical protein L6452_39342 [Arctium lappa]